MLKIDKGPFIKDVINHGGRGGLSKIDVCRRGGEGGFRIIDVYNFGTIMKVSRDI